MFDAMNLIAVRARAVRATGLNYSKDVPSPCSSVCSLNEATGWCEGCLRTRDEIAAWGTLGNDAKRTVWRAIEQRAQRT